MAFFMTVAQTGVAQPFRILPTGLANPVAGQVLNDTIGYHAVHVDQSGNIIPWYSPDLGKSYDHVLKLVWKFWNNMELDTNGIKYYMNHQVWRPNHDERGIGGDQVMMALSSWDMLYNYLSDESILGNMKYQADYYLANSLTSGSSKWPYLPYPYNMNIESGIYDGDMRGGKGVLQPDKAGSLGFELVHLYKKTGAVKYLKAALKIAQTLASRVQAGDGTHSPWPFKVSAISGNPVSIGKNDRYPEDRLATYTSNWTSTLGLFSELISMNKGDRDAFQHAFDLTANWMRTYPAKTNDWGPFFEDVVGFSNTQINATTYAMYLMEHPQFDPNWKSTVKNIFEWVHKELGNKEFVKFGVDVTNEQTVYLVPGNSHSSRQASMELLYWSLTGDTTYTRNAIKELSWATYMVADDGRNYYPRSDVWMTDGYGDYVRHYIRAMAAVPQLAPSNEDHMLKSSSIVQTISYKGDAIKYKIYDKASHDLFTLAAKPAQVTVNGKLLKEKSTGDGWQWQPLDKGGILIIEQQQGDMIKIIR
ncbi:MAG: hypothetical protein ABI813_11030 [Bacteroidota bacterium]